VDDVRNDPRYVEFPNSERVRSELVIPLTRVLDLESINLGAFSAEHERMLVILGSYIAIALENSRLYETSGENQLRLQSDLDTARDIQRQLPPQHPHKVHGVDLAAVYKPARELAGDFYDFLPYGDRCLATVVGDVSGKGTAAALYAAMAIGVLREHTADHKLSPSELMATLNRRLCASHISPGFVALLFAHCDMEKSQLHIANAGIPWPILVRDGHAQELKIDGTPLGSFPDLDYEILELATQPQDIFVFASDGILESMNAHEEQFGFKRLAETLRTMRPDTSSRHICGCIGGD
jgi:sigma-B regulation protein RsbU (phosphoserine phosphatase)